MMRATYAVLATVLMTLALTGHLTPPLVFVIAAHDGHRRPSDLGVRGALVATIMPHDQLIGAISLSRTTMDTARIAGALSGAGLFASLGIGPAYAAIVVPLCHQHRADAVRAWRPRSRIIEPAALTARAAHARRCGI